MISSRAETLWVGWASTGMPRPLSATETLPSWWMVIAIRSQWPARASSTELSTISVDEVVQAPHVRAADEHAGAPPDGLEPLQDLDVGGGVAVPPSGGGGVLAREISRCQGSDLVLRVSSPPLASRRELPWGVASRPADGAQGLF